MCHLHVPQRRQVSSNRAGGPKTHRKVCSVASNAGGQHWLGSDWPVGRNVLRCLRPNGHSLTKFLRCPQNYPWALSWVFLLPELELTQSEKVLLEL